MRLTRKSRVRMHLISGTADLPSVEGLLVSRRNGEYLIAVPSLINAANSAPDELDARFLAIPRDRVAFFEVL